MVPSSVGPTMTSRKHRSVLAQYARSISSTVSRIDMHHLAPAEGSRRKKRRIARGYGGKGGGTGGRGTRGQTSRSGGGTRPGFEGGQTPLYRRLPKLKGIAGGMRASLPAFVVVNLDDLERNFSDGEV